MKTDHRHNVVMNHLHQALDLSGQFESMSQVFSSDKGSVFIVKDKKTNEEFKIKMELYVPSNEELYVQKLIKNNVSPSRRWSE